MEDLRKLHEEANSAKKLQDPPDSITPRYTFPQSLKKASQTEKDLYHLIKLMALITYQLALITQHWYYELTAK